MTSVRLGTLLFLVASTALARVTTPSPVPEPGTLIMLAAGIGAAALVLRKRLKR